VSLISNIFFSILLISNFEVTIVRIYLNEFMSERKKEKREREKGRERERVRVISII
jgi:hypothetical protein